MMIRSDPPGAPVWIDQQYAGETPLDHEFAHYGTRAVRVGPIRGEEGKVQFTERQGTFDIEAPWYETFPLDFFAEVLWPFQLRDEHRLPLFTLPEAGRQAEVSGEAEARELIDRAESFREQALTPIPESGE